ncbi:MAG: DUF4194 domain-containing protein [Peptococcaceae bacterium]|nr:DUF4194 domain-containing protein [Peptococcaceae bacterium]
MNETRELAFSRALVALMKNPVNKDLDPAVWDTILEQRFQIGDYMEKMGLELVVDEVDGYAYLKQQNDPEGENEIPRLIPRHPLSYSVSLLLVLLRKKLLELDAASGEGRLVLSRQEMTDMVQMFMRESTDEAKIVNDIARHIDRIRDMGFLRRLAGQEDVYEVQRILRGFINAEWMNDMSEKLDMYRKGGKSETEEDDLKEDDSDDNGQPF